MIARKPTRDDLVKLDAEHGGVVSVFIVHFDDAAALAAAVLAGGDPYADRIAMCVRDVLSAPRQLCMLCERMTPKVPLAVGVLMAYRDDPSTALGFTFCNRHAVLPKEELTKLVVKRLGMEVRPLTGIHTQGGAA